MRGPVCLVAFWVGVPELTETTICSGIFWTWFHSSDIMRYGSHFANDYSGPLCKFLSCRWSSLHLLYWGFNPGTRMLSYPASTCWHTNWKMLREVLWTVISYNKGYCECHYWLEQHQTFIQLLPHVTEHFVTNFSTGLSDPCLEFM